jgi:orotate phosphoribosyltransferase
VALDRQERGNNSLSAIQEIEQEYGIPVISLINLQQLMEYLTVQKDPAVAANLNAVAAYRNAYGVDPGA